MIKSLEQKKKVENNPQKCGFPVRLVATIIIAAVASVSCSKSRGTTTQTTSLLPLAQTEANCANVSINNLANNPYPYVSKDITFSGTILSFIQDSSGEETGINIVPADATNPMAPIIYVYDEYLPYADINVGDNITIWGVGQGFMNGTNSQGVATAEASVAELALFDTTNGYRDDQDATTTSR